MQTCTHTHKMHKHMVNHIIMCTCTHAHTTHMCIVFFYEDVITHAHAYMHTYTQTRKHIHTHKQSQSQSHTYTFKNTCMNTSCIGTLVMFSFLFRD